MYAYGIPLDSVCMIYNAGDSEYKTLLNNDNNIGTMVGTLISVCTRLFTVSVPKHLSSSVIL